jgi:hypothetical protein
MSLTASHVLATPIYDEVLSGDLSNSGLSPTSLIVTTGANEVFGTTGTGANGADRDYFRFTVPNGLELTAIVVLPGTETGNQLSFFGVQSGSQVTVDPNAGSAAGLLGWTHYNAANGDIINDISIPFLGSTGFTPPLGAGTYSFWIQELSQGAYNYGFKFEIQPASAPVPDAGPGLLGYLGVVGALIGFTRRPGLGKNATNIQA